MIGYPGIERMGERTMKVVVGYVPGPDDIPRDIRALGLVRRVAFVLDTFRSDKVDMYFDAELYVGLVDAVREITGAERMSAVAPSGERVEIADSTALAGLLEREPEVEREPLQRIFLYRSNTLVCAIGSEPWAQVGGPELYQDSYTVPVYSSDDLADRLEVAARSVCSRLRAELTRVFRGSDIPMPPGVLARVRNW